MVPLLTACSDFCEHYQIDTFPGFINTKLMYLMPDIVDMPEISVDPASLVLYYCVLYHGSLMISDETRRQEGTLEQKIYICCLRAIPAWEGQAVKTKTDLIAAILLVRRPRTHGALPHLGVSWDSRLISRREPHYNSVTLSLVGECTSLCASACKPSTCTRLTRAFLVF